MNPLLKTWYPGKLIFIDTKEEWDAFNIPHIHVFDSYEGLVFNSNFKIIGLMCNCGSILMTGK